jgi:hypothetical protein
MGVVVLYTLRLVIINRQQWRGRLRRPAHRHALCCSFSGSLRRRSHLLCRAPQGIEAEPARGFMRGDAGHGGL